MNTLTSDEKHVVAAAFAQAWRNEMIEYRTKHNLNPTDLDPTGSLYLMRYEGFRGGIEFCERQTLFGKQP